MGDGTTIMLATILGTLTLAFGVVGLRVWLESKKTMTIRDIVKTLAHDPSFKRELAKELARTDFMKELTRKTEGKKRRKINH